LPRPEAHAGQPDSREQRSASPPPFSKRPLAPNPSDSQIIAVRTNSGRVLVVEDEPDLSMLFRTVLNVANFEVDCAPDGQVAIEMFRKGGYDLIITDLTMPQMDGMELLRSIRRVDLDIPVVIVTAAPGVDSAMRAVEYGALRYLPKPVKNTELVEVAHQAVNLYEIARMKRRALAMIGDPSRSIGDHAGLDALFQSALDALFMSFQPIVSWSQHEIVGYEALVRSREPRMAAPGTLFDAAKRLNRFRDLSRKIRVLAPQSFQDPSTRLFLNVDVSDLEDELLYDRNSPLAKMSERVVVELTERVSLESIQDAHQRVARLRDMGYKIAIDDLGAGYAGLSYFGALEPDLCKLDMTLVRGIHTSVTKQKIVSSITRMCSELGIALVCEGVETAAERDVLLGLGCDLLQGYLFARPRSTFPGVNW
jgi:EAL domain-containing protein (putative c-di-GMP-specific phosphodiesterase class I)/ActR/RegA family two-component response regulator